MRAHTKRKQEEGEITSSITTKRIKYIPSIRHIIVCGNISYETVSNFLKDFLHEDRQNVDVEVVFLHRSLQSDIFLEYLSFLFSSIPDLDLERLLKKRHTRVKYFQGSLMNALDMERVKVNQFQT